MSFGDFLADFYEHLLQVLGCIGDKSDASQASAGHPRLCASSCSHLRVDLDVCPAGSPIVHLAQAFVHAPRSSAHAARASPPPNPPGTLLRTSITISLRHAHPFSLTLKQLPLILLDGYCSGTP